MSAFTEAVEAELDGIVHTSPGASPGCAECLPTYNAEEPGDDWHDLANEGGFSWSRCDGCGSSFGGDRYPAHGFLASDERGVFHLDICVDCVMYLANGDEPEEWQQHPN